MCDVVLQITTAAWAPSRRANAGADDALGLALPSRRQTHSPTDTVADRGLGQHSAAPYVRRCSASQPAGLPVRLATTQHPLKQSLPHGRPFGTIAAAAAQCAIDLAVALLP